MRKPKEYADVYCGTCQAITRAEIITAVRAELRFVQCESCGYRKIITVKLGDAS